MLAVLVGSCVPWCVRPVLGATSPDTLIQVLFGDLPSTDAEDANGDGTLTIADVLVFGPPVLFAGTAAEFVPHDLGDQLVYRITDPLGVVSTETTLITSSAAGGVFVLDDQEVDGHQKVIKHETQTYTDTGAQLFFSGGTDEVLKLVTTCSPPLLRLTTPLLAGQMSSTTTHCIVTFSNGVLVGDIDRTDSFTPIDIVDSVTVPAGIYTNAVHVSGHTKLTGGADETDEFYFVPGIGAILQLSTAGGQTTRHELIGGVIGGVPVGQ